MTTRANVTSVDAIKSFRASLVLYASKARPTLEEVTSGVVRTRVWLETEQRIYWEAEVRRRTRKLEDAQQALFSAKMSSMREVSAAEQMAVTRAKNALEEAENKLKTVKRWNREYDGRTEPLARQLEKMHTLLAHDIPMAIAYLNKILETLDAYANIAPPTIPASLGQPGGTEAGGEAAKAAESADRWLRPRPAKMFPKEATHEPKRKPAGNGNQGPPGPVAADEGILD